MKRSELKRYWFLIIPAILVGMTSIANSVVLKEQWLLSVKACSKCNLRGAYLQKFGLDQADLSGADLREAQMQSIILDGANLRGANLSNADLRWAWLERADLSGANLSGANLQDAHITGTNFNGANLQGAKLHHDAIFNGSSTFCNATMPNGSLRNCGDNQS
jgi:uncharacterized protein YjbI with pentapeptide repeats